MTAKTAHGVPTRGLLDATGSRSFEGRFGRLFRELPAASFDAKELASLANAMVKKPEADKPLGEDDDDENPGIPSGYTYLGQFIDHDITFDPASSLDRQNDPDALVDFRSPRLDLDSLYGRGPDDQPYLYTADKSLVVGLPVSEQTRFAGPDLPRTPSGRAIVGDPRNDENKIISQLHGLFVRIHNRVLARVHGDFAAAQRLVRWHYQYAVLHDYLPRIAGEDVVRAVLNRNEYVVGTDAGGKPVLAETVNPDLRHYHPRNEAYIPVEFSGAIYRFGHSMVRPSYLVNDFVAPPADRLRIPVFSKGGPTSNLSGFDTLPQQWGIQWGYFFKLRPDEKKFPQPSYRIDEGLSDPLRSLPESVVPHPSAAHPRSLAERNLLRGVALGLPSGQDVARVLGTRVMDDKELFLDGQLRRTFAGRAPLWYYVLRESKIVAGGTHLGPVGARLVAEVLIGLLWHDAQSFLRRDPSWKPEFGSDMAELVKFAEAPI
jgi:hypothetical protein